MEDRKIETSPGQFEQVPCLIVRLSSPPGSPVWVQLEGVDIQGQVASAWLLYAQGRHDDALDTMRVAADAEDKTEKHVVTPGPLAPAREVNPL